MGYFNLSRLVVVVGVVLCLGAHGCALTTEAVISGNCPSLNAPQDGTINSSSISYGSVVAFACNYGFSVNGNNSLECLYSANLYFYWSGAVPTCTIAAFNVNLSIGLCAVAVCIIIFSIIGVIICAIRRKKEPETTTSMTAGAPFSPSPVTMILPQDLQQFQQPVPVQLGGNIPSTTITTNVHFRNENISRTVALPPPNANESQTNLAISGTTATVVSEGARRRSSRNPVPDGRHVVPDDGIVIGPEAGANTGTAIDNDPSQIYSTEEINQCFVRDAEEESDDEDDQDDEYEVFGDDYLVPLGKTGQSGPKDNGTGSENAAAGPRDVDYLEVLPDEGTCIALSSQYSPGQDSGAQDAGDEYTYIVNIDTRALLAEPTEIASPPIYEYADPPPFPASASGVTNPNAKSSDKSQPGGSGERVIPEPPTLGLNFGSGSSRLAQDNHDDDGYVNQGMIGKGRSRADVM